MNVHVSEQEVLGIHAATCSLALQITDSKIRDSVENRIYEAMSKSEVPAIKKSELVRIQDFVKRKLAEANARQRQELAAMNAERELRKREKEAKKKAKKARNLANRARRAEENRQLAFANRR